MGTDTLAALSLAGSGIGAALGLPLVWPGVRRQPDTWLGWWFMGVSLIVALISGRVLGLVPNGAAAEHTINLIGLAVAPLIYMYVRHVTGVSRHPHAALLWLPALAYLIRVIGLWALGAPSRLSFLWILPVVLAFTAACVGVVLGRSGGAAPPAGALLPARPLVAGLVVLNLAQVTRYWLGDVPQVRAIVPLIITLELVAVVAWVAWRLHGSVRAGAVAPPRYDRSGLADDAARALVARVEQAMTRDRLFADPLLTLARLAEACESTPHLVSEALNRVAGSTFHQLVTRHRLADAKRQLAGNDGDVFSIEGIGQTAGFGSRSAFYAAFKKAEGMTPAEYRARRRAAG